jgi:hypothetical protein
MKRLKIQSEYLSKARLKKFPTQSAAAQAVGIPTTMYHRLENGFTQFSLNNFVRVEEVLGPIFPSKEVLMQYVEECGQCKTK